MNSPGADVAPLFPHHDTEGQSPVPIRSFSRHGVLRGTTWHHVAPRGTTWHPLPAQGSGTYIFANASAPTAVSEQSISCAGWVI